MELGELTALLDQYAIPWQSWGNDGHSKPVTQLLKEINEGEAELVPHNEAKLLLPHKPGEPDPLTADVDAFEVPLRVIRTTLVQVYCDVPRDTQSSRFSLIELKRRVDGEWHPRLGHEGTHLSEKMRKGESPEDTFLRCLIEELGLRHRETKQLITASEVCEGDNQVRFRKESKPQTRLSRKFPALFTKNHIKWGTWTMPYPYYGAQGYRERDEKGKLVGIFKWKSVASNEPLPVLFG